MFKERAALFQTTGIPAWAWVPRAGRGLRSSAPQMRLSPHKAFCVPNLWNPLKHPSELGYHPHLANEEIEDQEGI